MTNRCIMFLTGYVFLVLCGCAHSLKCYKCSTSSEEQCTANQTIMECPNDKLHCATVKYSLYGQTYQKSCFPPTFPCSIFNKTGHLKECSIKFCSSDYCNGPVPTTPTPVPGTSPSEVTTKQTTSKKENVKSAGSLSSSAAGLIAFIFLFGKILEICTVS